MTWSWEASVQVLDSPVVTPSAGFSQVSRGLFLGQGPPSSFLVIASFIEPSVARLFPGMSFLEPRTLGIESRASLRI